jgi:hypothetical protein
MEWRFVKLNYRVRLVWVWNLVFHIKQEKQAQGVRGGGRNLGLRERKLQETGGNYIARSFMVISPHQIGPPVIVTMGWAWHVACTIGKEKYLGVFVVKIERKRTLVRPRHRWKDNTKTRYSGKRTGGGGWESAVSQLLSRH